MSEQIPSTDSVKINGQTSSETNQKSKKEKKKKTVGQEILSWIMVLVSAVALAFVIRTFLFEPIRVDGSSMFSTLKDGELLFVTKLDYLISGVNRGDVIICKFPSYQARATLERSGEAYDLNSVPLNQSPGLFGLNSNTNYVKRLVAMPGDRVRLENGVLYVNDEAVDESYLDVYEVKDGVYYFNGEVVEDPNADFAASHSYKQQFFYTQSYMQTSFDEVQLGDNEYFVMGDNRGNSRDSRYYGTISREMIVGHVKFVFFPFSDIRGVR